MTGPALAGVATRLSEDEGLDCDWLYSWIRDPHRLQPDTLMPRFRLADDEVRDLAHRIARRTHAAVERADERLALRRRHLATARRRLPQQRLHDDRQQLADPAANHHVGDVVHRGRLGVQDHHPGAGHEAEAERSDIGVVPAWFDWPAMVNSGQLMPWTLSTAPMVMPSTSSTGPGSTWEICSHRSMTRRTLRTKSPPETVST